MKRLLIFALLAQFLIGCAYRPSAIVNYDDDKVTVIYTYDCSGSWLITAPQTIKIVGNIQTLKHENEWMYGYIFPDNKKNISGTEYTGWLFIEMGPNTKNIVRSGLLCKFNDSTYLPCHPEYDIPIIKSSLTKK